MAQEKTTRQQAIELVQMMEARTGDPNAMRGDLSRMYEKASSLSTTDRIKEYHKIEIARAYIDVSDGKGGVDVRNSHKNELARFRAAEDGFMPDGKTLQPSQRDAINLKRPDLMTEAAQARYPSAFKARRAESVGITHGNETARPAQHAVPDKPAVERVGVTMEGSRPSRGFARVGMLATTAALTAIAIPALRHLGVTAKEEPAIRMTSLTEAASGLSAAEPAKLRLETDAPGALAFAALRAKPPTSSGP